MDIDNLLSRLRRIKSTESPTDVANGPNPNVEYVRLEKIHPSAAARLKGLIDQQLSAEELYEGCREANRTFNLSNWNHATAQADSFHTFNCRIGVRVGTRTLTVYFTDKPGEIEFTALDTEHRNWAFNHRR